MISVSGAATASFTYDGDGNRVKATVNGTTTTFVGGYYELTGSQVTKYYLAGTQRVATRKYTILAHGLRVSTLWGMTCASLLTERSPAVRNLVVKNSSLS